MSVEGLPADQRAVIQLILTQGRSYADLAGMMGATPEGIRDRARTALTALAEGRDVPPDVADYLLGQQDALGQEATRGRIAGSPTTHRTVVLLVRLLAGTFRGSMPQIPLLAAVPTAAPAPGAAASAEPRTSLVGGAVLIVAVAALAIAVVVWAVSRGDDDGGGGNTATATQTATPTGTAGGDQPVPVAQLPLRSTLGGDAQGGMLIFSVPDQPGALFFQLAGEGLPANEDGNAYAVWLTGGGPSRLLGFAAPVEGNGQLRVSGPGQGTDPTRLPGWLDRARRVVVTRETAEQPSEPGEVVLSGRRSELQDLTQGGAGAAAPTPSATP